MGMAILQQLNQSAQMVSECLLCSGTGSLRDELKKETIKSLLSGCSQPQHAKVKFRRQVRNH